MSAIVGDPLKNLTNMYKTNNEGIITDASLNSILALLSVGDAKHDFHYPVTGEASLGNLRDPKVQGAINYGLPSNYDNVLNEEDCLSSVIRSYTTSSSSARVDGKTSHYVPIDVANPIYRRGHTSAHSITTINGHEFTVNYTDVKQHGNGFASLLPGALEEKIDFEIPANVFYTNLGLNTTRFKTIAIVVDAASIGLYEILNSGTFSSENRPNVYYIYGAEVVNDPATKKTPESKVFLDKSEGVILKSCLPIIKNTNQNYNYKFHKNADSVTTPYLNQFFTKFDFLLSDIKTSIKGKSSEYITNLTISGNKSKGEINPIINSKSKNDITFLTSVLNKLLNIFGRKAPTDDEKFLFSSSLQQKRSGDWLQVLLCSAIKDKLREFRLFNSAASASINDIQEVFFVTHDRIALAFALLNGINCFFTHHNSKKHFHSVFAYTLNDPESERRNFEAMATFYKGQKNALNSEIQASITVLTQYKTDIYDANVVPIDDRLNNHIRVIANNITTKTSSINDMSEKYDVTHFGRDTIAIFTDALESIFVKSIYPNLNDEINILRLLSSDIDTDLNDSNTNESIVKNYNKIRTTIDNIMKQYIRAKVPITEFTTKKTNFKKSYIYKTAADWKWDIDLNSRIVDYIINNTNNPDDKKVYHTDRNIFLYNLNELDKDVKTRIAWIYYHLYMKLTERCGLTRENSNNTVTHFCNTPRIPELASRNYKKFRALSLSFCIEVLLNLEGGNGINISDDSASQDSITKILDNFLTKIDPMAISVLITDTLVVAEDNEYNKATDKGSTLSQTAPIDTGINDISSYQSPEAEDKVPLVNDIPVIITGGGFHISGGAFEITIKQVTYPLMTLILNASNDKRWKKQVWEAGILKFNVDYDTAELIPNPDSRKQTNYPSHSIIKPSKRTPDPTTSFNTITASRVLRTAAAASTPAPAAIPSQAEAAKQKFLGETLEEVTQIKKAVKTAQRAAEAETEAANQNFLRITGQNLKQTEKAAEAEEAARAAARAAEAARAAARAAEAADDILKLMERYESERRLTHSETENIKTIAKKTIKIAARVQESAELAARAAREAAREAAAVATATVKKAAAPAADKASKKIHKGGSIENLKKLFDSLPPLPEDTPPINFDKSSDVFSDNTICFHPLLPIYMLIQTYMSSVNNENIEESLDFDVFVNYLKFLKKIKEDVVQIYSGENNNNENKMEAYAIGLGLKQLLFVSNNNNEGYQNCLEVLGTNDKIYSSASSLTESLVSAVSGNVTYSETDLQMGNIFLNSDLFKSFATNLEVDKIFGFYADSTNFNLDDFRAEILAFSIQVANQIISDRTANKIPLETILSEPLMSSDISSQDTPQIQTTGSDEENKILQEQNKVLQESAERRNLLIQQKIAEGTFKDFGEQQRLKKKIKIPMMSSSDLKKSSSSSSSGNPVFVTSSVGSDSSRSRGGKTRKTRKHKKYFKNRKTKKNNRNPIKKITKKNKRLRKNKKSRK